MRPSHAHDRERGQQKVGKKERASRERATAGRRLDVPTRRKEWRLEALADFARQTGGLKWSKELFLLLLDELYVGDEFDAIIGPPENLPARRYPQATAFAIALRHSWRPDNLNEVATRLGLLRDPCPMIETRRPPDRA